MNHICPTCQVAFKSGGGLLLHFRYHCPSTPEERFWARVEKTDSCWLYRGALNRDGYGTLTWEGRIVSAHRTSWTLTNGAPAKGKWVLHKCDVRACCNPDHLYIGVRQDNVNDMVSRDRHARGARSGKSNLNDDLVREIRSRYRKINAKLSNAGELAAEYGCSRQVVNLIGNGSTWRHLK